MANLISWGSIKLLHNLVTTFKHLHNLGDPLPVITYRAKVKLHGTNMAVQVHPDRVLVCQSRTTILTPEDDYKGFTKWVHTHRDFFSALSPGLTVFGEWCGPGVEKGMAISAAAADKVFAVFALQEGNGAEASVIYDPAEITKRLHGQMPRNMFVLPWEGADITLDYTSDAALEAMVPPINHAVQAVEQEDPWVKATFGVSGLGEGLVYYPIAIRGQEVPAHPEKLLEIMFKAKGEKHRVAGDKQAAQIAPEVLQNTAEFVGHMVTEARLIQGVNEACGGVYDVRHMGKFLAWLVGDVQKESSAELAASGLTWKQVQGPVQARARDWYKNRTGA